MPLIARDVIVMGSAMVDQDSATKIEGDPGDVRAYDVRTGKLRWTFHVVPTADDAAAIKTWVGDSWQYTGAGNVWSLMSADDELGYVYLPTTSVTNDMYGGARLGDNLYSTSIVCVDAATGKRVWHYQTVHHDLFDYDNPAAPILADITVDGKKIKAVAQITKQSWAYVLDRVTGKPVWPIVEKPVPASTVPGEKASPTQPFPSKPPAFDRQGITEDDLIDFTPELRAEALAIFKRYRTGPVFTPPSIEGTGPNDLKGTIELPGSIGGADWTGAAFDPETGMLYVPSMTNPFVANLIPGDPKETNLRYRASTRELIQGPRGLAAGEAALRPHHRARSQSRRTEVDDREWRRSALSSGAEGAQSPAARPVGPRRAARDEDAAVRDGGRSDQRAHAAERRRQEDPRLRQGDRPGVVGNGARGRAAPAR